MADSKYIGSTDGNAYEDWFHMVAGVPAGAQPGANLSSPITGPPPEERIQIYRGTPSATKVGMPLQRPYEDEDDAFLRSNPDAESIIGRRKSTLHNELKDEERGMELRNEKLGPSETEVDFGQRPPFQQAQLRRDPSQRYNPFDPNQHREDMIQRNDPNQPVLGQEHPLKDMPFRVPHNSEQYQEYLKQGLSPEDSAKRVLEKPWGPIEQTPMSRAPDGTPIQGAAFWDRFRKRRGGDKEEIIGGGGGGGYSNPYRGSTEPKVENRMGVPGYDSTYDRNRGFPANRNFRDLTQPRAMAPDGTPIVNAQYNPMPESIDPRMMPAFNPQYTGADEERRTDNNFTDPIELTRPKLDPKNMHKIFLSSDDKMPEKKEDLEQFVRERLQPLMPEGSGDTKPIEKFTQSMLKFLENPEAEGLIPQPTGDWRKDTLNILSVALMGLGGGGIPRHQRPSAYIRNTKSIEAQKDLPENIAREQFFDRSSAARRNELILGTKPVGDIPELQIPPRGTPDYELFDGVRQSVNSGRHSRSQISQEAWENMSHERRVDLATREDARQAQIQLQALTPPQRFDTAIDLPNFPQWVREEVAAGRRTTANIRGFDAHIAQALEGELRYVNSLRSAAGFPELEMRQYVNLSTGYRQLQLESPVGAAGMINPVGQNALSRPGAANTNRHQAPSNLPPLKKTGTILEPDIFPPIRDTAGDHYTFHFDLPDGTAAPLRLTKNGDKVNIKYIGGPLGRSSENVQGTVQTRAILNELREYFPDMRSISGFRVGGAQTGNSRVKSIKIPPLPPKAGHNQGPPLDVDTKVPGSAQLEDNSIIPENARLTAGFLGWLFDPEPTKTIAAEPLKEFPSRADAEFAQDVGFGYGTRGDAMIQQGTARVPGMQIEQILGSVPGKGRKRTLVVADAFEPMSMGDMARDTDQLFDVLEDKTKSKIMDNPELAAGLTRSLLAINRSSLATLGFDPSQITVDKSGELLTLGGVYYPRSDKLYSNAARSSNLVHETLHRGLDNLIKNNPEAAKIVRDLEKETGLREAVFNELMVRYLMVKHAGDAEAGGDPKIHLGAREREQAIKLFTGSYFSERWAKQLDVLDEMAAEMNLKKRALKGPK